MKKIITLTLAMVLALSLLTACSGSGKANPASDFTYSDTSVKDYFTITNYRDKTTDVVIPNKIEGKIVTAIGGEAFLDNTSLTSVTIPENVLYIGYASFFGCTSLKDVTISANVEYMHYLAFYGCTSLSEESKQTILQINPDAQFGETKGGGDNEVKNIPDVPANRVEEPAGK